MSAPAPAARVTLVRATALRLDEPLRWLPEAYAALWGRAGVEAAPDTPSALIETVRAHWPAASLSFVVLPAGEVCGFAAVERCPTGGTVIHALAVRRSDRNLGYGVEAVILIEAAAASGRIHAPIPRGNGLAIYFWLRAGYRPVSVEDDGTLSRDPEHLWMMRDIALSGVSRGP